MSAEEGSAKPAKVPGDVKLVEFLHYLSDNLLLKKYSLRNFAFPN
jgi:hypothetical protein